MVIEQPSSAAVLERLPPVEGHRSDIQMLRGLAVLLVVCYHADILVPGGFIGVDVFFVVSGFVIGRWLVARLAAARPGLLAEFFARRVRRILPALAATLVVVVLLAPALAPVGSSGKTSPTGVSAALFVANFYLYGAQGGYFTGRAELNPLLHTWSLSVEEQFYFVIPALMVVAWLVGRRRLGRIAMLRILVGVVVVVSFVLCVQLTSARVQPLGIDGPRLAFYSPFTRAWEFGVGLALVLVPVGMLAGRRLRAVALVLGLGMVLYAAFSLSDTDPFPGTLALWPVIGTALAIYAGTTRAVPGTRAPTHRALRPLQRIGDVSYSWYLWHWPLIVFAGAWWAGAGRGVLVVAAAVSLVPAWISYRRLEQPLRRMTGAGARTSIALAAVCILAPIAAALVAVPLNRAFDRKGRDSLEAALPGSATSTESSCDPGAAGAGGPGYCYWGAEDAPRRIVAMGDSNMGQYRAALPEMATRLDARVALASRVSCPVLDVDYEITISSVGPSAAADCRAYFDSVIADIEAHPPDAVLVAVATDNYTSFGVIDVVDRRSGRLVADERGVTSVYEKSFARTLTRLTATGTDVVVLDVVPKAYTWDSHACSNLALIVHPDRCIPAPVEIRGLRTMRAANALQSRAARRAGATTVDLADELCGDDSCGPIERGVSLWSDGAHISDPTAQRVAPVLAERVQTTIEG